MTSGGSEHTGSFGRSGSRHRHGGVEERSRTPLSWIDAGTTLQRRDCIVVLVTSRRDVAQGRTPAPPRHDSMKRNIHLNRSARPSVTGAQSPQLPDCGAIRGYRQKYVNSHHLQGQQHKPRLFDLMSYRSMNRRGGGGQAYWPSCTIPVTDMKSSAETPLFAPPSPNSQRHANRLTSVNASVSGRFG